MEDLLKSAEELRVKVYQAKPSFLSSLASAIDDIRKYAPILDVFTQGQHWTVSCCWGMTRLIIEVRFDNIVSELAISCVDARWRNAGSTRMWSHYNEHRFLLVLAQSKSNKTASRNGLNHKLCGRGDEQL